MSTLEHEVIEKFYQLDKDARQRVRTVIERETEADTKPFDFDAWVRDVEAIREQIRASNGGVFPFVDAVTLLRQIRDGEDE